MLRVCTGGNKGVTVALYRHRIVCQDRHNAADHQHRRQRDDGEDCGCSPFDLSLHSCEAPFQIVYMNTPKGGIADYHLGNKKQPVL